MRVGIVAVFRMLKQFLDSLSAVRRGLPIPKYRSTTELILLPASYPSNHTPTLLDRLKTEDDSIEDGEDDTDGKRVRKVPLKGTVFRDF